MFYSLKTLIRLWKHGPKERNPIKNRGNPILNIKIFPKELFSPETNKYNKPGLIIIIRRIKALIAVLVSLKTFFNWLFQWFILSSKVK